MVNRVKISVYYTPECPKDPVVEEIKKAVEEAGLKDYELEEVLLASDEEAAQHKVLGVPTVRINGVDVDPSFEDKGVYTSTCSRIYKWAGKYHDYPPKEMIVEALRRVLSRSG